MKHALENSGEIVLYPTSPFQTVLSAFKEGQALSSARGSGKSAAKNLLGCASWNPWLYVSM